MAWTITQTIDKLGIMKTPVDFEMFKVKLACTSDASGTDTDLSTAVMEMVNNSFLWLVICDPGSGGAAPSADFQLELQNEDDISLFDSGAGGISATVDTVKPGTQSAGMPPPFFDTISLVCGTLGDANTADFYLYFAKGM